jgi:hypothetical protein
MGKVVAMKKGSAAPATKKAGSFATKSAAKAKNAKQAKEDAAYKPSEFQQKCIDETARNKAIADAKAKAKATKKGGGSSSSNAPKAKAKPKSKAMKSAIAKKKAKAKPKKHKPHGMGLVGESGEDDEEPETLVDKMHRLRQSQVTNLADAQTLVKNNLTKLDKSKMWQKAQTAMKGDKDLKADYDAAGTKAKQSQVLTAWYLDPSKDIFCLHLAMLCKVECN